MWRYRFVGKTAVEGAFALPIVVPEICMGVSMLLFFTRVMPWPNNLIWPLSLGSITIAHVVVLLPLRRARRAARGWRASTSEQEEAARDLGANDWQAFRDVLLPHMQPGADRRRAARLHPVA